MDWKLEVVTIPVADLDRARDFYAEKGSTLTSTRPRMAFAFFS
jgi:catechol 2,3-dioxygenase-like lactoylglutathione lyase family enzyme